MDKEKKKGLIMASGGIIIIALILVWFAGLPLDSPNIKEDRKIIYNPSIDEIKGFIPPEGFKIDRKVIEPNGEIIWVFEKGNESISVKILNNNILPGLKIEDNINITEINGVEVLYFYNEQHNDHFIYYTYNGKTISILTKSPDYENIFRQMVLPN